jgi:hypothetical protein
VKTWFILVVIALVLVNCASQRAAERAATDADKCSSYGFKPGSDAYAQCRMTLDIQRQQACQAAQNNKAEGPAVSGLEAVGHTLNVATACH